VVVNSTRPEVSVRVNTTVQTDIDEDSYSDTGEISVAYDPSGPLPTLVIRDA
jgi:hypothetical protein